MEIRPYTSADREGLWACKRAFETGLGTDTGDAEKAHTYAEKLTEEYRDEWFEWVDRCRESDERCVVVAHAGPGGGDAGDVSDRDAGERADGDRDAGERADGDRDESDRDAGDADQREGDGGIVGYVFVLPETFRFVWDAAVINELYLAPEHRGTGVADDLMDAALAFARDQDLPLDRVVLDVDRANERARAFYASHGFEHWGELVARER